MEECMKKSVVMVWIVIIISWVILGCDLFFEIDNEENSYHHSHHLVNLDDIDDTSSDHLLYREYERATEYSESYDLFTDFFNSGYGYVLDFIELYADGFGTIENRSSAVSLTVSMEDEDFKIIDDTDDSEYLIYNIDYLDFTVDGNTTVSIADMLNQVILEGEISGSADLSALIQIYRHDMHMVYSITGYLQSEIINSREVVSGKLQISWGSRIYTDDDEEDLKYAGKLVGQLGIKEFSEVPISDLEEAFELFYGLSESATPISDWYSVKTLLWGRSAQECIGLTTIVGDNLGEIARKNIYDLEVLEALDN